MIIFVGLLHLLLQGALAFVGFYTAVAMLIMLIPAGQYRDPDHWKSFGKYIAILGILIVTSYILLLTLPQPVQLFGNEGSECHQGRFGDC